MVHRFAQEFDTAGGINLPKIIKCHGTDGLLYKQVVKGEDDMRQDAVMQQVLRRACMRRAHCLVDI